MKMPLKELPPNKNFITQIDMVYGVIKKKVTKKFFKGNMNKFVPIFVKLPKTGNIIKDNAIYYQLHRDKTLMNVMCNIRKYVDVKSYESLNFIAEQENEDGTVKHTIPRINVTIDEIYKSIKHSDDFVYLICEKQRTFG